MGTTIVIVLLAIGGIILLALLGIYNGLVKARLKVREAWSTVEVQLQRRYSLIPNLVETVKGYAAHERETFDSVTAARAAVQKATTVAEKGEADNVLTGTLKTLFAVAEAYPDLKANQNFMQLQRDLADTEDKISYARTYYNATVRDYNTSVQTMPNALVAGAFGFQPADFFQGSEESQAEVEVKF